MVKPKRPKCEHDTFGAVEQRITGRKTMLAGIERMCVVVFSSPNR